MRDHKKLKAFECADKLAFEVYSVTRQFPKEELFGLTSQIRRAAVSVPSNIVEGCARHTEADYLHFLDIAFGSIQELGYQLSLAFRLGYLNKKSYGSVDSICQEASRILNGLIRSIRNS